MSETNNAAGMRIASLLDANSFVEVGGLVTARSTDFNLSAAKTPSDGVITGYGTVEGNLVYIYSQDASVLGGTVGEMHARKIARIYSLAMKTGAPVIGLIDCGGVRLEESTDALNALGLIMGRQAWASGVVPQIAAVYGSCGGGLAAVSALADFTFVEKDNGRIFVNAPDAIPGNSKEKCDTSSADWQFEAGNCDFVGSEEEIAARIRQLVGILPLNNEDEGASAPTADDLNRDCGALSTTIDDAKKTLEIISDGGLFFETKGGYASSMLTGFISLNGYTVGAVANSGCGTIDADGAAKAARFISFCDAFNIPVFTLVNATGFKSCECQEARMPWASAKLAYAYASATVPKVTLVAGKAYGTPYVLMGSRALGADMVYAWKSAEIGTMDAAMAAKIMAGKDGDVSAIAGEYSDLQLSVNSAAARGYVDTVIDEADTRKYLIGAFEMLYTKRLDGPDRKHGTV